MIDERIEHLITRKLDGELTDAEALELDKALLRHPEARQRYETLSDLDGQADEALRARLGSCHDSRGLDANFSARRRSDLAGAIVRRGTVGLAAAAALAFVILPRLDTDPMASVPGSGNAPPAAVTAPPPAEAMSSKPLDTRSFRQRAPVQPVGTGIRGDVFGVVDPDTGRVYMIELPQHRPANDSNAVLY